jgi:hypothetical protein
LQQPSVSLDSTPPDTANHGLKVLENSAPLLLPFSKQRNNGLHSICFGIGVTRNQRRSKEPRMWKVVANTAHPRDSGLWNPWGIWEPMPSIPKKNCTEGHPRGCPGPGRCVCDLTWRGDPAAVTEPRILRWGGYYPGGP